MTGASGVTTTAVTIAGPSFIHRDDTRSRDDCYPATDTIVPGTASGRREPLPPSSGLDPLLPDASDRFRESHFE